jgi:hypothetical protein
MRATVQAIDASARKVTVKTEQGASVTLGVPEGIAQFGDIKVGDVVNVSFRGDQVTELSKAKPAPPPAPGWQIDSKDGSSFIKFGFLAQPQAEWLETADAKSWSQNLFLRRMRLLLGGKIANRWLFFVETDSPNLGKGTGSTGVKDTGNVYIQDAYFTFDQSNDFKVDVGMILMPMSWNHLQSAASLLPVDYGPFTFIESGPIGERVGRDYGAMLRGYPLKQHIEYRVGVFQGLRGTDSRNPVRFTGRAQVNFLQADTGFFHLGTAQGTRHIFSVGTFFDTQKSYKSYGIDAFGETNVQKKAGITGQFDWVHTDGETFITALPKQDTLLIEAGVTLARQFTPFIQYSTRNYDSAALKDQSQWQLGFAYWMRGHQRNIKLGVGQQHTDGLPDRTQVQLQLQLFYY